MEQVAGDQECETNVYLNNYLLCSKEPLAVKPVFKGHSNVRTPSDQGHCIPRTKYVRGILWFSRRYAASAASASAASADTSSFSR